MQQPLEERVDSLETASARHEQTLARLAAIEENQDHLLERLLANHEILVARQDELAAAQDKLAATQDKLAATQDKLAATQDVLLANQQAMAQLLEEFLRDAAITRRLWLRLAQRYGWLDDEQNGAQPQNPA